MDATTLIPLAIPATVIALAAIAKVAGDLATQAQTRQDSRVAQIEGAVARVAGDIAASLLPMQATTPADLLKAVKAAAAAEGASYIAEAMPATVAKAGATTNTLIAMVSGEVGKQMVANASSALLSTAPAVPAPAPPAALAG